MHLAPLFLLVPLLLPPAAVAQKAALKLQPGCDRPLQAEMNACAADAYAAADAELNAAYRRITARLANAPGRRSLVEAQRAWIRFRDAECDLATSHNEGGSIRPMMVSFCMERLTRQRTEELKGYMRCRADDGCVAPAR